MSNNNTGGVIKKTCHKCHETKPLSAFSRDNSRKDGLRYQCKACVAEYSATNREKIAKREVEYRIANKDRILKRDANYRATHRKEISKYQAKYYANHREEIIKRKKEYRANHLEEKSEYYANHREEILENMRNRRASDIQYRLVCNLRRRLRHAIKNNSKTGSAVRDLGCSIVELKKHLEKQFQTGMTWDNYGRNGWHIDHIKPLASFDLTDRDQLLAACHYTNLQPLWASENLSKSDKILPED